MTSQSGSGATVIQAPPAAANPPVTPEDGPEAIAFSPSADQVGVSVSANLIVEFDRAIVPGAGNVTLKQAGEDVTAEAWDVVADAGTGAGQVNVFAGTQLTMRLTGSLTAATGHYVIWDAGVVRDIAGNPCAAQASTTAWSFTTA